MHNYVKVWISSTEYRIRQIRDDGIIRFVDEDHGGYLQWCAGGNVPEEIPYVEQPTIVDSKQSIRNKLRSLIKW